MDYLKRIKNLLDDRGWTMYQLSRKSKIPQSTLSNLFIRNNAPTIPTLERICKALGITLVQFFNEENEGIENQQEKYILCQWRKLSPESQKALVEFLESLNK